MKIIELCGVPGSGKSTSLKACREKYPELFEGMRGWSDLYPPSKISRALIKGITWLRASFMLLNKKERRLFAAVSNFERESLSYAAGAISLYGRILKAERGDDVYLLDEGLAQRLSSAAFVSLLPIPPIGFKKTADAQKSYPEKQEEYKRSLIENSDLFPPDIEYFAVYFYCDTDECANRVKDRGRRDRYGRSGERMKELLEIKDRNIRFLTELLGAKTVEIKTDVGASECARELAGALRQMLGDRT